MSAELTVVENMPMPVGLFSGGSPEELIATMTRHANSLKKVVVDSKLIKSIPTQGGPREFVRVEGWTLLGSLVGVFPVCVWTHKLADGWEARVEARTLDDRLVGAAEAQCTRDEQTWARRSEFALRSMAQTRATSKALRLPLGFIMSMAGYSATPAEEMEGEQAETTQRRPARQPSRSAGTVEQQKAAQSGQPHIIDNPPAEGESFQSWWGRVKEAKIEAGVVTTARDAYGKAPSTLTLEERAAIWDTLMARPATE